MPNFTINSLSSTPIASADAFMKSNTNGVYSKCSFNDLSDSVVNSVFGITAYNPPYKFWGGGSYVSGGWIKIGKVVFVNMVINKETNWYTAEMPVPIAEMNLNCFYGTEPTQLKCTISSQEGTGVIIIHSDSAINNVEINGFYISE